MLKSLATTVGVRLLAFAVVDTHLHTLAVGDRFRVGEWLRRVELCVGQALRCGAGFDRCYVKPVETQAYLANCLRYVLSQHEHHATYGDPLWEGSALHELNGLRRGRLRVNVRRYLPRVGATECAAMLGVDEDVVARWDTPIGGEELVGLLDAVCAGLELDGLVVRGRAWVAARQAAVGATAPEVSTDELARALAVSPRSIRRLRQGADADPADVRVVRRQLRYRAWGRSDG